jgi:probable phosphoglycerate mutase
MYKAIIIRPGETDFDREERIQGSLNLPLNANGWKQVSDIIERLREDEPDMIFSSPSEPSRSTATMISEALDIPVKELEGLANMDQGLWQGMLLSDLRRKLPRVYKQWQESPDSVCAPAGEQYQHAVHRVERALKKPMKKGGRFVIVASEPLASVASFVLQGKPTSTPSGPPCCSSRPGMVEVIDSEPAVAAVR